MCHVNINKPVYNATYGCQNLVLLLMWSSITMELRFKRGTLDGFLGSCVKILGSVDVKDEMQQFPSGLQRLRDTIRVIASDVRELKRDMKILKAHHRKDKKKRLSKELRGIGAGVKYTTKDEVEVQPGCDVLRGDEGHVDHGGDEDLPFVPTSIVSQPLEGATTTSHRSISNQYDEMGGVFPPDEEGNGAFINVDCRVMPCPTQNNHHEMMLLVDDEHVELPAIGVDVLNGAQIHLTHNDNSEITPALVEKAQSVEHKEIMEETSRHNDINHENHEQHTNTVQRNHIVDGLAQFDRGAMPEVAILSDRRHHICDDSREEYGRVPYHPTSFASRPPNTLHDMEQIRYEWQHRGPSYVHGFLWLDGAPDMDALHWDDPYQVLKAKHFFDTIVHAWNPREPHQRNIQGLHDLGPIIHIGKGIPGDQEKEQLFFETDIGLLKQQIAQNWRNMRYSAWHVNSNPTKVDCDIPEDEDNLDSPREVQEGHEWEILSALAYPRSIPFTDVDMLDEMRRANNLSVDVSIPPNVLTLGNRQCLAFEIIMQHYASCSLSEPLKLIIQVTTGTGKSYLIRTIKDAVEHAAYLAKSTLLLLAPTGVEELHHVTYVMIDEMSFIRPKLMTLIDSRLHEAFPEKKHQPFRGRFMILIGDLGYNRDQLKSLNIPIARSIAEKLKKSYAFGSDDDRLELEVLVAIGARVMLTPNLWTDAGLVNGALGTVQQIVYALGLIPPSPPSYVVVDFDNYIGSVWDPVMPMSIPIVPITRRQRCQLPLRLAWALTIYKS
eukprot:Gb_33222 [translate_table: standard]